MSEQDNQLYPLWIRCLVGVFAFALIGAILVFLGALTVPLTKMVGHAAGALTKAASDGWAAGRR